MPDAAVKILEIPSQLLEKVIETLAKVGIELPALGWQLFLLALVMAVLYPAFRKLRSREPGERAIPLTETVALGLIALGIVWGVVSQTLLPRSLWGHVISINLQDVRVQLLDFRGRTISSGSGAVDTETGAFVLDDNPIVNGRARTLRIVAQGCAPRDYEIPRSHLRAGSELQWEYDCQEK